MDKIVDKRSMNRVGKLMVLGLIPTVFLILGITYGILNEGISQVISGFSDIIFSPTILLTDFLAVGGIGATLINVSIVGFINIYIMDKYKLKINGVLIAAFFTVIGFAFFGKNVFNIIPIYLGGVLYAWYKKISFKDIIVVIMFGTALSPLISEISFAGFVDPVIGLLLAMVVGIFIGFVLVPLSSHMMKFHEGFNLYNIGFTSGIIGTVITSLLRSLGITIEPVYIVSDVNQWFIISLVIFISVALMILGIYLQPGAVVNQKHLYKYKGRLITDFTYLVDYGSTYFNMGLLGMISLAYVFSVGGVLNGPVLAGVFTVIGFGAFGKHLRNTIPVVAGVIVTALLFGYELSATGIIISVLFSTTLSPVAGTYGPVIGFIAGVMHMVLVTNVGVIHGGINLYNNGFSGGIVAGVLVPIVKAFKKE